MQNFVFHLDTSLAFIPSEFTDRDMYCRSPRLSSVWWFTWGSHRTQHGSSLQHSGRTWANSVRGVAVVVVVVGTWGEVRSSPEALSPWSLIGHGCFLQEWVVATHEKLTQPRELLSSVLWAETLPKPRPQVPIRGQAYKQVRCRHKLSCTLQLSPAHSACPASAWLTWVPSLLLGPAPPAVLPFLVGISSLVFAWATNALEPSDYPLSAAYRLSGLLGNPFGTVFKQYPICVKMGLSCGGTWGRNCGIWIVYKRVCYTVFSTFV